MIPPILIKPHIAEGGKNKFRLWLPLFLIWPLMAALLALLSPIILIILMAIWVSAPRRPLFRSLAFSYQLLCALRGLEVEVVEPDSLVKILIK